MLLLAACSEDFKVGAPYKNVTSVFSLLDVGDTAHYIRIQKAFLDESQSALELAQVEDSNFYKALDVTLRDIQNGAITGNTTLQRVDLTAEGYPKQEGAFFKEHNWAYKTTQPLLPGHSYRLIITNTATGGVDSAETPVIDTNDQAFRVIQWVNAAYKVSFPAKQLVDRFVLNITVPDNAYYMEGYIRFRWADRRTSNGQQTDDSADYNFATVVLADQPANTKLEVLQNDIYKFLHSAMGTAPEGIERRIDSCDLTVYAATSEFYRYLQYTNSQGGITADQIQPIYTNIKGADVVGLFAGRTHRTRRQIQIDDATIDSLQHRQDMQDVVIRGRTDH